MPQERISPDVVLATREYLRLSLESARANVDSLPASVRLSIRTQRFGDALASQPLLRGLSRRFVADCVDRVAEDAFVSGMTILRAEDIPNRLCIILEGSAQLQVAGGAEGRLETVAVLRPGAAFGAGGFLCSARQPWEVRARTLLRVLTLGAGDRRELERAFPHARRRPAHPRPMARHRLAHRRVRRRPRICTSFAATCSARSSS